MAQEQTPDDFDWAAAQANCNAASMFVRLQAGVVQDVRRRNGLLARNDGLTFEVYEDTREFAYTTRVVASGFRGSDAAVKFQHACCCIHVHSEEVDVDFTAVVALDTTGVCRFVVGEAIYSEWEIRRMALEHLFFEEEEAQASRLASRACLRICPD